MKKPPHFYNENDHDNIIFLCQGNACEWNIIDEYFLVNTIGLQWGRGKNVLPRKVSVWNTSYRESSHDVIFWLPRPFSTWKCLTVCCYTCNFFNVKDFLGKKRLCLLLTEDVLDMKHLLVGTLTFFTFCRLLGVEKILGMKLYCWWGDTLEGFYLLMRLSSTLKYVFLCFLPI